MHSSAEKAVVIEHNGDVYACDHFVYQPYKLGNIADDTLAHMVEKSLNKGFGRLKETALPTWCRDCPVLKSLSRRMPEAPFQKEPPGEPGLHYLCVGIESFSSTSASI